MKFDKTSVKRLVSFALILILVAVVFLAQEQSIKIIAAFVLLTYVGFVIFLRDNLPGKNIGDPAIIEDSAPNPYKEPQTQEVDEGEGFEIVGKHKNVEIITSDNYKAKTIFPNRIETTDPELIKEDYLKIANEVIPSNISDDALFGFVIEKLLQFVKEAFLAHSAVFFWYNKKTNRISLDKFASSSKEITRRRFELENDVLSEIIKTGSPKLIQAVSPNSEQDTIRYYNSPQGIRCFLGAPVFFHQSLVGIIAIDSKEEDVYGIETIWSLGRLVRAISIIIDLFEEKYSESLSEKRLKSLLSILSFDERLADIQNFFETIEKSAQNLIQWDAFAFVYYDSLNDKFTTVKISNKRSVKYIGEGLEIDLKKSLVGQAIQSGMPVNIDDTSIASGDEFIRYSPLEDVSFEGSFLAIPLVYLNEVFGVVCFENLKKSAYSNSDVKFLRQAFRIFSFLASSNSKQTYLKSLLSVDIETKLLNKNAFLEALSKDLLKAKDFNAPGAIVFVRVDEFLEQSSLFEGDPFPKVLKTIVELIKESLDEKSLFARLDKRLLAIHFFNTTTKDAYLWAEKTRVKIARKPIPVMSRQSTFTVSIGVASTNNKTDVNEILKNAKLALDKAIEKGGNAVINAN